MVKHRPHTCRLWQPRGLSAPWNPPIVKNTPLAFICTSNIVFHGFPGREVTVPHKYGPVTWLKRWNGPGCCSKWWMLVGSREGDYLILSALINSPHFARDIEDGVSLFLSFLNSVSGLLFLACAAAPRRELLCSWTVAISAAFDLWPAGRRCVRKKILAGCHNVVGSGARVCCNIDWS